MDRSVLVLEDDLNWQKIVGQAVKVASRETKVTYAFSTQQAMDFLRDGESFDLIIADQNVEGLLTGMDFYKHCQSDHAGTPFVLMSGMSTHDFAKLTESELQLPTWISKNGGLPRLTEFATETFLDSAVDHELSVKLSALLALTLAAAVAISVAPKFLASHTAASPVTVTTQKERILSGTEHAPRRAKAPAKTHFVSAQLHRSLERIAQRADQIDQHVAKMKEN